MERLSVDEIKNLLTHADKEHTFIGLVCESKVWKNENKLQNPESQGDDEYVWYYKDGQGQIQGPYEYNLMCDWYEEGYFTEDLEIGKIPKGNDLDIRPTRFTTLRLLREYGRHPFAI